MTDPSLPPPYVPVELTDVELAFPAHGLRLMPERGTFERKPDWEALAKNWFGNEVKDINLLGSLFMAEHDFDPEKAWRHLRAIMGSFEPKHEHKIEAVGFLLGTWFRWCQWTTEDGVQHEVGDKRLPKLPV